MAKDSAPIQRVAYNVNEFCQAVGISRAHFYNLPVAERPRMVPCGAAIGNDWHRT
jgi:hypothetical protein